VRLTVLGGCGAYPAAGEACGGYLVEHEGFRVLLDPGYATLPRLLALIPAAALDAVLVTHGHPDHCADLNPLLRARALDRRPAGGPAVPALPVYALPHALDAVLALDRPGWLEAHCDLRPIEERFTVGPFAVASALLPHFVPNAALRLSAGGASLVHTGDGGPSAALVGLARGADLLLAEASFADAVPAGDHGMLCSAADAARQAAAAGVGRLLLTHLIPGTTPAAALAAATAYPGPTGVTHHDLQVHIGQ
jgi:ribonuclease BN (tRNA processing enzyme)